MANEKCCCDCVSCISTNMPFEVGVWYVCINPKGKHHLERSIYQWDKLCEHFMDGKKDSNLLFADMEEIIDATD